MISKDKQYRTRDGREVRIYATDGYTDFPVHGAVKNKEGWMPLQWHLQGYWHPTNRDLDLIEVKPRIKRDVWIHIFNDGDLEVTDNPASAYITHRIACVKVVIDCEEGEGL